MPKTKISEFSATPGNNTDIDGINIAEGCAPSGINDAIRELMAQLKDFQAGTAGDSFNGPVGTTTAAAGAFTTLSASSTVSGAGFSTYLASPPAIGGTAAAAGSFTTLTTSSTVTHNGGTANGVAYLNGSKVLTTGSALTFDGTNLLQATGGAAAVFRVGSTVSSGRASTINLGNNAGVARATIALDAGTELMTIGSEGNFPVMFQVNGSEQARLTSTGLGIGTSSPAAKLNVVTTGGKSTIAIGDTALSTYSQLLLYGGSGKYNWSIGAQYNVNNAFEITPSTTVGGTTFSTPAFVIDSSSNVGIGTSSPAAKLHVSGGRTLAITGNESYSLGIGRESNTNAYYLGVHSTTNPNLLFSNNAGTTNLTLTYDGNLGLGVTPSAWETSLSRALQLNGGSLWGYSTSQINVLQNAYYNASGNFVYTNTAAASAYRQISGAHSWLTAASGTAGNAITFTQAMTLTAAGGLVVGGTADPGASNISAFGDFRLNSASYSRVADLDSGGGFAGGYNLYVDGTTVKHDSTGAISGYHYQSGGVVSFFTGSSAAAGTIATERARIDSSGNLLFGTTTSPSGSSKVVFRQSGTSSPDATWNGSVWGLAAVGGEPALYLSSNIVAATGVAGATQTAKGGMGFRYVSAANPTELDIGIIGTSTVAGPVCFYNDTERARITSGGAWQVGTSGVYTEHATVQRAANEYTTTFVSPRATAAQNFGLQVTYSAADPNGTGNFFLYCEANGTIRANIRSNGGIANYSANNVNLSDRREKTNFAPAKSYIDAICAIPVQTFNYVDQNMEEDPGLTLGVVAQDVQAVAPELVMESNWAKEGEDPKMRLSIYQTDLQYALMKCIQEQQVMINELKAKVAALEAK